MGIKGKIGYIPKDVMNEVASIRIELSLQDDNEALKKMANRSNLFRKLKSDLFERK